MQTRRTPIRLALREEGSFWNAYLAQADTMDNATLIGSIRIGAAKKDPEIKAAFMAVMQQVLDEVIVDVTGEPALFWETVIAPEAERSGHS